MTERTFVHPDLMNFDLRLPYSQWPERVRRLIERRQRESGHTLVQGPRCALCGDPCIDADKDATGHCPACSKVT